MCPVRLCAPYGNRTLFDREDHERDAVAFGNLSLHPHVPFESLLSHLRIAIVVSRIFYLALELRSSQSARPGLDSVQKCTDSEPKRAG